MPLLTDDKELFIGVNWCRQCQGFVLWQALGDMYFTLLAVLQLDTLVL